MSSGSSVRTHYAPQTTIEATPTTGWKTLPVITNGLTVNTTLTDSEILGAGRLKQQGMVTGGEIAGDMGIISQYLSLDSQNKRPLLLRVF